MLWRTSWLLCCCGLVLALAGCQRLHHEKTFNMKSQETKSFGVDAPKGEQKVEVTVTASNPVAVFVVLESELSKAEVGGPWDRKKALASKTDAKSETLQATIPAGQAYGV